jgi:hypothetical protein
MSGFVRMGPNASDCGSLRPNRILNQTDVPVNLVFRDTARHDRRPLGAVIAHERVHAMMGRHFGDLTCPSVPDWKQKGYCEYIGGSPSSMSNEGKHSRFFAGPADRLMTVVLPAVIMIASYNVECRTVGVRVAPHRGQLGAPMFAARRMMRHGRRASGPPDTRATSPSLAGPRPGRRWSVRARFEDHDRWLPRR